jgi:hypothetical protein
MKTDLDVLLFIGVIHAVIDPILRLSSFYPMFWTISTPSVGYALRKTLLPTGAVHGVPG